MSFFTFPPPLPRQEQSLLPAPCYDSITSFILSDPGPKILREDSGECALNSQFCLRRFPQSPLFLLLCQSGPGDRGRWEEIDERSVSSSPGREGVIEGAAADKTQVLTSLPSPLPRWTSIFRKPFREGKNYSPFSSDPSWLDPSLRNPFKVTEDLMIHARDCELPAAEDSHCRWRHAQPQGVCEDRADCSSQEKSLRHFHWVWASPVVQWQRIGLQFRSRSRGGFDSWVRQIPLEKGLATHCRILAWRIPWTEQPGGLHTVPGVQIRTRLSD